MWIYRSPIGILKIVRQPDGTFGLYHNETVWQKPTMFFVM